MLHATIVDGIVKNIEYLIRFAVKKAYSWSPLISVGYLSNCFLKHDEK